MIIDSGGSGDAEFDAFASAGDVEGDFSGASPLTEETPAKPAARRGPPREAPKNTPAASEEDDDNGDGEGDEGGDEEEGENEKPKLTPAQQQINRLKREKADLNRRLRTLEGGAGTSALQQRIDALESRLTTGNATDTKNAGTKAPDPSDTEKYPLGHLDDRYIEDKLEWLAEQKASKQADSILQRQQETELTRAAEQAQQELLGKVDTLATKGSELFEDFQESVVEAGMRGDWKLSQTTFEAAHDAENGAQILYNLANDPKEAARVASLTPFQQLKYVADQDAEIGTKGKARVKPQAGDPPKNTPRGANSKVQGNPATDDLDDFEKQWERQSKGKK